VAAQLPLAVDMEAELPRQAVDMVVANSPKVDMAAANSNHKAVMAAVSNPKADMAAVNNPKVDMAAVNNLKADMAVDNNRQEATVVANNLKEATVANSHKADMEAELHVLQPAAQVMEVALAPLKVQPRRKRAQEATVDPLAVVDTEANSHKEVMAAVNNPKVDMEAVSSLKADMAVDNNRQEAMVAANLVEVTAVQPLPLLEDTEVALLLPQADMEAVKEIQVTAAATMLQ